MTATIHNVARDGDGLTNRVAEDLRFDAITSHKPQIEAPHGHWRMRGINAAFLESRRKQEGLR